MVQEKLINEESKAFRYVVILLVVAIIIAAILYFVNPFGGGFPGVFSKNGKMEVLEELTSSPNPSGLSEEDKLRILRSIK